LFAETELADLEGIIYSDSQLGADLVAAAAHAQKQVVHTIGNGAEIEDAEISVVVAAIAKTLIIEGAAGWQRSDVGEIVCFARPAEDDLVGRRAVGIARLAKQIIEAVAKDGGIGDGKSGKVCRYQRRDEIGDDGDRQIPARRIEDDGYRRRAVGEAIIVAGGGDERVEAGGVGGPREAEVGKRWKKVSVPHRDTFSSRTKHVNSHL